MDECNLTEATDEESAILAKSGTVAKKTAHRKPMVNTPLPSFIFDSTTLLLIVGLVGGGVASKREFCRKVAFHFLKEAGEIFKDIKKT